MTSAAAPLQARGLAKRYGRRLAVESLDLDLAPGEVLGLLGPNGAGKTTTVKMLLGLVRPDAGTATLFGLPAGDPAARRRVGYLPETFAQPEWSTGEQVLGLHARMAGVPAEEQAATIARALDRVGLAGRGDGRVGGYSKGMRQRLGLAAALLGDPGLVILDEPTSALDPIGRREVRDLVRDLRAAGTAVLLNSHLLGEVEQVCDRVVVMDRGQVLADRPVHSLVVGGEVRVAVEQLTPVVRAAIEGHGVVVQQEGHEIVVALGDHQAAPDLAAAIIAAGGRLRAMVPLHTTLEDLFVQLVADHVDGAP